MVSQIFIMFVFDGGGFLREAVMGERMKMERMFISLQDKENVESVIVRKER